MDKKLNHSEEKLDKIKNDFEIIEKNNEDVIFTVWDEIPTEFEYSYYLNEQEINPTKVDFENWKSNLHKRPEPKYSVAIIDNEVVSSIYSGKFSSSEKLLNLWHTNEKHRNKKIGKGVLLNSFKHIFENDNNTVINAWDITSEHVDIVLTEYGFE